MVRADAVGFVAVAGGGGGGGGEEFGVGVG